MDARELLRRYLEQRRELGEQELVLDGMDVEEVLRLVGAMRHGAGSTAASPPSSAALPAARPRQDDAVPPPRDAAPPTTPAAQESRPPAPAEGGGRDFDWRSALRAAGGLPDAGPGARPARPTEPPASARTPAPPAPGDAAPAPTESEVQPRDEPAAPPATRQAPVVRTGRESGDTPAAPAPAWLAELDVPLGLVVGGGSTALMEPAFTALRTLDEVAATVEQCTRCPLYKTATHGVPGEGNPDADLVCVGEAPGESEDQQGRPFVGASGQLLTKILAAIKLSRDEVFISNVLKHRPPGNRNPQPDEVAACSPYLLRQLELIKPKVILTFGTFASQTLLGTKTPIGKLREHVHLYHGIPLVVTYHPAALLRNPAWKRPTWNDVQLARRILDHATGA